MDNREMPTQRKETCLNNKYVAFEIECFAIFFQEKTQTCMILEICNIQCGEAVSY